MVSRVPRMIKIDYGVWHYYYYYYFYLILRRAVLGLLAHSLLTMIRRTRKEQ